MISPCLVFGTGIYKELASKAQISDALHDWKKLLFQVCETMQVDINPELADYPTLFWEQLLIDAVSYGFVDASGNSTTPKDQAANEVEKEAKKIVASILRGSIFKDNGLLSELISSKQFCSAMSLNFDCSWDEDTLYSMRHSIDSKAKEKKRIYDSLSAKDEANSKRIWYPNGCVKSPETIRLGLREFGLQTKALEVTFREIKDFEEIMRQDKSMDKWVEFIHNFIRSNEDQIAYGDATLYRSWILDFLFCPLIFAGVGLSQDESGLWWLLAQRARNLAKIDPNNRPPTIVIRYHKSKSPTENRDLFSLNPLNIIPVYTTDSCGVMNTAIKCANEMILGDCVVDRGQP